MPDMFSDFMATFFANMMPYIVLMQAGAYCWFMNSLVVKSVLGPATNPIPTYILDQYKNAALGPATFSLFLALACLLCPWRTCIGASVDKADVNSDNTTTYNERALYFPSDYDRENPLTKKQGELRILGLQIAEAEKEGDGQ